MDMFGRATKIVKKVGENMIDSAKTLGTSIYCTSKEQSEIASMKLQKSAIERELQDSYAKIGKRYVDYMNQSDGEERVFDISDILAEMNPNIEKLEEIESILKDKESEAKRVEEEKYKKKAQDEFESQKEKLDKALAMEIITEEEYNEKLVVIQKKYDNYEQLRKIDIQLQMGIISKEEHMSKINNILN